MYGSFEETVYLEDPGLAIYRLHFGEQHTTERFIVACRSGRAEGVRLALSDFIQLRVCRTDEPSESPAFGGNSSRGIMA
jgi:hypothetical protein